MPGENLRERVWIGNNQMHIKPRHELESNPGPQWCKARELPLRQQPLQTRFLFAGRIDQPMIAFEALSLTHSLTTRMKVVARGGHLESKFVQ